MKINKFNTQTVRRAFLQRAADQGDPIWSLDAARIHEDVYPGAVVGGVTLHFVTGVQKEMVKDLLREAFLERVVRTHTDLSDISPMLVLEDVFGAHPENTMTQDEHRMAREAVYDAWYSLLVEETLAERQPARRAKSAD